MTFFTIDSELVKGFPNGTLVVLLRFIEHCDSSLVSCEASILLPEATCWLGIFLPLTGDWAPSKSSARFAGVAINKR